MNRLNWLILVGIALGGAPGCSDMGIPLKPKAQPLVSSTTIDFGTVAVRQSVTRNVTLSNIGSGTLTGDASLSASEYTLESGGGAYSLAAGESRIVVVKFTPNAAGDFPCELSLGPNAPAIAITGAAALQAPGAHCSLLQDSLAFGAVKYGETAAASIVLINDGTAPLLVDIVSSSSDFRIVRGGGPSQIDTGRSMVVTISFSPTASSWARGQIDIGPECPVLALSGFGITVSYAEQVKPILNNRCGSCHWVFGEGAEPDRHFNLVTPNYYTEGYYVAPYDVNRSKLYQKMIGNPTYGQAMPPGVQLPASEIEILHRWITEGARNN